MLQRRVAPSWDLVRECHLRHEVFALRARSTGQNLQLPDWEWADLDGERLVWASAGCLWAAGLGPEGLVRTRLLKDFNDMEYRRTRAPY